MHRIVSVNDDGRGVCMECGPRRLWRDGGRRWRCPSGRGAGRGAQPIPQLPSVDLAWLAGFLEGEGSFSPREVVVKSVDRDVLERVARLCGGRVRGPYVTATRPTAQPIYAWGAYGDRALGLMEQLLPLMGERRSARIRELLSA